jgi:hypothetical protein
MVSSLALNKPWFYFIVLCSFFGMLLVWMGNSVLPVQGLASSGWAWHHIPEIASSFFLGAWLGSLGHLSSESLTYHDGLALFLVAAVGVAYAELISYIRMFPIVLTILFISSFLGYFAIRLRHIQESRSFSAESTI